MTHTLDEIGPVIANGAGPGASSLVDRRDDTFATALANDLPVEPDPVEARFWSFYSLFLLVWWPLALLMRIKPLLATRRVDARHRVFWRTTLYRAIRRAVSMGDGASGTWFLGVTSIYIGVLFAVHPGDWWLALAIAGGVLGGIFTIAAAGYTALRVQTPARFAETLLDGRSMPEAIRVTAFLVRELCLASLANLRALHDRLQRELPEFEDVDSRNTAKVEALLDGIAEKRAMLDVALSAYTRSLLLQTIQVERVQALKRALASRLGLPRRRVCDHLLQFSPALFASRMRKYAENWQTLAHAASRRYANLDRPLRRRIEGLLRQNERIHAKLETRVAAQDELLDETNTPLLAPICRIAAMHSSSGSILRYAWLVAAVAGAARNVMKNDAASRRATFERAIATLRFLRRKHRAYPGIELHDSLLRICDRAIGAPDRDDDDVRRRKWEVARLALAGSDEHEPQETVGCLSELGLLVEGYVAKCRGEIVARVVDVMRAGHDERPFGLVVTTGYSKTVRQAIRESIGVVRDSEVGGERETRVFVLTSDDPREEEEIDTRQMVFELAEPHAGRPVPLAVGTGPSHVLASLLRPGEHVLFLIGAECWSDTLGLRVVHPRIGHGSLDSVVREVRARASGCRVVALAENYKHREDLLAEATVFRHHLDRLVVHEVDAIVTEDEVLATRRLLLAVLAEPSARDRVTALVREFTAWRGIALDVAGGDEDDDSLRDLVARHDVFLQVIVEPRPRGRRRMDWLARGQGVAIGMGKRHARIDLREDHDDWRVALGAALAKLIAVP
ncbi:MAG: hypothetical protein HZB39_05650 [Planctomycetes bacterium]|nr:hypothetical protein [Planctomycetota bacterium]